MSITGWGGDVQVTLSLALSAATSTYGIWDGGIWDSSLWGPDTVFADFSSRLRSFSTEAKFSRGLEGWTAGTATIVLDNRDGALSPANLGGPFVTAGVTQIRPMRPVMLTATNGGVTYPLYRGYVLNWQEDWKEGPGPGLGDAWVVLSCADEFTRLAAVDGLEVAPIGAGESSGARVHRTLDAAGHTGPRSIDTGVITVQATTQVDDILTELDDVTKAEGGALYVGPDGTVIFDGRYALIDNTRSVNSQATFSDVPGGGKRYASAKVDYTADLLINWAVYGPEGLGEQSAFDSTSRALYGDRRESDTEMICETEAQALTLAQWRVQQYKDPEYRISQIVVKPRRDPTVLWPEVLGRALRDQITVIRTPPGGFTVTSRCHIAGITHQVNDKQHWETTYDLWSATIYVQYAASRFDVGLWDSALWFF